MSQRHSDIITTSFLLSNLHCPSCVSHIKDILSSLNPKPISISPWIASSWVTIEHDRSLPVQELQAALEDGGFEVCDTTSDDIGDRSHAGLVEIGYLDRVLDKWTSRSADGNESRLNDIKNTHIANCNLCQQEANGKNVSAKASASFVPRPPSRDMPQHTQNPPNNQPAEEITSLDGSDKDLSLVIVDSSGSQDIWRASLAVGGMTCAACVGNITEGLNKKPWIRNVVVNLIGNSATVDFIGRENQEKLIESFDNIGYDAAIDDVISLRLDHDTPKASRTIEIKVDGMFCGHCPPRILAALEVFQDQIEIEKPLSIEDPVLKLTYTPKAPSFTIRNIIAAISEIDGLVPTIYHPPTLEERSRKIHEQERNRLLVRVTFTFVIAIPTLVIGIVLMSLVSSQNPGRRYFKTPSAWGVSRTQWALFALATPVWFLCADVFHIRALKEVRALWRSGSTTPILRRFYRFGSMNMLMSLGTSIAYLSSIAQLIAAGARKSSVEADDDSFYFDSVVFLTLFLLVGRLIEAYSKSRTGDAVTMLGRLRPSKALLVEPSPSGAQLSPADQTLSSSDVTKLVPVDMLEFSDMVKIPQGKSPPCDGKIVQGETKFDESSLTGESKLVKKVPGAEVFSGTINKESPITIRVTGAAGSSMLDQIVKAVREGQTKRAPVERIADSLTAYFVPLVTLIAICTWIVWLSLGYSGALPASYLGEYSGGWVAWSIQFAIAVFVVACPCGLALAAPTALFVGGGLAAQHGILVKGGGEAFEKASKLDCIVFDKTGTLTRGGEPTITDWEISRTNTEMLPNRGIGFEEHMLGIIGAIEANSTHTIAKALTSFCKSKGTEGINPNNLEEIAGKGMKGSCRISGETVDIIIGNEALMVEYHAKVPEAFQNLLPTWKSQGKSVALAAVSVWTELQKRGDKQESVNWQVIAAFAISDPIRTEAPAIIRALQQRGTEVWMLSGDNKATAIAIGAQVGILPTNIIADVLPSAKADTIRYLQRSRFSGNEHSQKRALVAMVGDGINDSPALTAADIGIAIGSGSDIAISSAMFVLVSSNLNSLLTLLDLSKVVFRRIKFNFGWALIYNMIALPVAAGVFFPIVSGGSHVRLAPVWASLAMAASSISVVLSSLALRSSIPGVGFKARKSVGEEEIVAGT